MMRVVLLQINAACLLVDQDATSERWPVEWIFYLEDFSAIALK